jgi:hypothetical protein
MRPYSKEFIDFINNPNVEQTPGVELARLCVAANIPATYVAHALETTRVTVYGWFRGKEMRKRKRKMAEVLIDHLKEDLANQVLPAKDAEATKRYIEELTGIPM